MLRLQRGGCFITRKIHHVQLCAFSFHTHAMAARKSTGFCEAGHRREAYLLGSRWHDEWAMVIFQDE